MDTVLSCTWNEYRDALGAAVDVVSQGPADGDEVMGITGDQYAAGVKMVANIYAGKWYDALATAEELKKAL